MRHRRLLSLPLLCAALLLACARPPPGGAEDSPGAAAPDPVAAEARAAIEAANEETSAAMARGDVQAIAEHYAEDAIMLPSGADFVSGADAIRRYYQRALDAGVSSLTFTVRSVDVSGDIAVETGSYEARDARGSHLDHGKYVVAWRRHDGRWRIFRDISTTSMPPPVYTPATLPVPAAGTD